MPQFRFVARSPQGAVLEGVLDCPDKASAIREVEKTKGFPVRIQPVTGDPAKPAAQISAPQTSATVLSMSYGQQHLFTEQLALLLNAGMTLDEALGILVRRMKHPKLHGLAKGLHVALVEGRSLSQALRDYPKIFSPLYVNMVAAGEASGTLGDILMRLVTYLTDVKALRDRVQQALVYPALLVVVGAGMVTLFMTVMVPKLMKFFDNNNQELPTATKMLIGVHDILAHYWWMALLAIGALVFGIKAWSSNATGRRQWDALQWRLPGYGTIIQHRYFAQFASTLSTLTANGVILLKALELIEDIAGNSFVRDKMKAARQSVVDGMPLSNALGQQQIFPELFLDMLAVGEQSGRLSETLGNISQVYGRELDKKVSIISTLIPPLVMVGIAIVVGFVIYGILSAVFSMTKGLHT